MGWPVGARLISTSGVVAIESKCLEPMTPHVGNFAPAYDAEIRERLDRRPGRSGGSDSNASRVCQSGPLILRLMETRTQALAVAGSRIGQHERRVLPRANWSSHHRLRFVQPMRKCCLRRCPATSSPCSRLKTYGRVQPFRNHRGLEISPRASRAPRGRCASNFTPLRSSAALRPKWVRVPVRRP